MKTGGTGDSSPSEISGNDIFQQGNSKQMSREERRKTFALLIQDHLPLAVQVGALNLPLVDITALSFVQLSLLRKVTSIHGLDFAEPTAQAIRHDLLTEIDTLEPISEGVNELAFAEPPDKLITDVPGRSGADSDVPNITVIALSAAASTYALAKVIFEHLERGGTLSNFDAAEYRARFQGLFREGRSHPLSMLELKSLGF